MAGIGLAERSHRRTVKDFRLTFQESDCSIRAAIGVADRVAAAHPPPGPWAAATFLAANLQKYEVVGQRTPASGRASSLELQG